MKKIISAISATAILVSSLPFSAQVSAEDEAIKIMCIGDSITDGYTFDYVGSYRKFIYHNLTEKGYNIDMVGSKNSDWTPAYTDENGDTWEFDNDNTGYSGYAIKEYSGRSGIYETLISTGCLAETKPDIVTLQIGTNDIIDNHEIDKAGERLEVLVDYILENIPENSVLFISEIPHVEPNRPDVYDWFGNYRHSADWSEQYDDEYAENLVYENIEDYNLQIRFLCEKKQEEGKKVVLSGAGYAITDVSTQLFDGVHPNNAGYYEMGKEWTNLISDYLENKPLPEETTTATTTETTSTTEINTTTFTEVNTTTTTTTTPTAEEEFKLKDLVNIVYYVLGHKNDKFTKEAIERYDLNKSGKTDVYDVIIMRSIIIENGNYPTFDDTEGWLVGEIIT